MVTDGVDDLRVDDGGWQGGQALGSNLAYGVASLADGSVVLAGQTDGDFTGTNSHAGGIDFAIVKLTADGETEWTWQVTEQSALCTQQRLPPPAPLCFPENDDDDDDNDGKNTWRVSSTRVSGPHRGWLGCATRATSVCFPDPMRGTIDARTLK